MITLKKGIALAIAIFFGLKGLAQFTDEFPNIRHFSLEEGLSQVSVNDMVRDCHGFVWIATADGLNRFDGKLFTQYKDEPTVATGIKGSFINKLITDQEGNLWLGTLANGLSYFDRDHARFTKVVVKQDSTDIRNITALEIDPYGNLFIGSDKEGLYRLSLGNHFQHEFVFDESITALKYDSHRRVLWIGALNGGIFKYDPVKKEKPELVGWAEEHIRTFFINESKIFIGSNEGVFQMDAENHQLVHIEMEASGLFETKYVLSFLEKDDKRIWVGTGNGIYLFNWADQRVEEKFDTSEQSQAQITNNTVHCFLGLDTDHILVGTASGLNQIDLKPAYFNNISKDRKGARVLNDNVIFSIYKNRMGLWVGTSRGGLNLITPKKTYAFTHHKYNTNHIAGSTVRGICEDTINNRLWLATSRGLSMMDLKDFDPENPQIRNFYHDHENANSINTDFLKDVVLDHNNHLWGATFGQGIFRLEMDEKNNPKIYRYRQERQSNSLVDNFTQKLLFDDDDNLWIGTQNGISKLQFQKGTYQNPTFDNYQKKEGVPSSLSANSVYDIDQDGQGYIWVGTRKGLNRFNGENFEIWNAQPQFPNDIIYGIQNDGLGNLWLATNNGIVRFDLKTKSFSHYGLSDNIQGKEFDIHARFLDSEGTVYLGGIDGVTYFNPKDFEAIDEPQDLYFSGLRLKNESREQVLVASGVMNVGLVNTKKLDFGYNELPFYLDVSTIDYRLHKDVDFAYRLLPGNEDWIALNDREIQFVNLPSGEHRLEVNGFSRGAAWDQDPLVMDIRIRPPFWRTWWAYALYLIALGFLTYTFYRFKLSKKLAIAESEKLKELNSLKNTLFTNVTHEFRTPLTVILGLAESAKEDLMQKRYADANEAMNIIKRNGNDLLQLVNQLLELSKIESGTMQLNPIQANIIPFLRYICQSFESLAKAKGIDVTIYSEVNDLVMDFDDAKIQTVLSNLFSNAIKFSPENERIIFHINKAELDKKNYLILKVKDNGVGIPQEAIPQIFDRFYQVESSYSKAGQGSGIGLSLAKDFIEMMGGTILVNSEEGRGTQFEIRIPIRRKPNTKLGGDLPQTTKAKEASYNIDRPKKAHLENTAGLPTALIIEDNADVAYYLSICLREKFHCLFSENGKIATETAFEEIPDIVISDVMMPEMDGYEVCKLLKTDERTDHIPIILLTAKAQKIDRLIGLQHGADAYLGKPFFKAELLTRLDQLLLLRKRMIQNYSKKQLLHLAKEGADNPETKFLQKVIGCITEQLDNTDLGARHIARHLGLSESQIYRKLKAITDKSTAVFIRSVRLEKARELLQASDKSISEIAYSVGFNDPSWFSRAFKEEFNLTPTEVQNEKGSKQPVED